MKKTSIIKYLTLTLILIFVFGGLHDAIAQGPPGFEDDVTDVPDTPINGFIAIAMAAGAYFGGRKLRKK